MRTLFFVLMTAIFAVANTAQASVEQLIIKDCDGLVRATADSPAGRLNKIQITLSSQSGLQQAALKLSEPNLGAQQQKLASDGKVTFEEIGSGEWSACPEDPGVQIADVSISRSDADDDSVLMAGILGGGAIGALAIAGAGDGGGSSQSATTLSGSAGIGSLDSAPAVTQSSVDSVAAARPIQSAEDCLNAERPDPLSPFL